MKGKRIMIIKEICSQRNLEFLRKLPFYYFMEEQMMRLMKLQKLPR